MITDLTTGSPTKLLWKFTMPMLLSVVFQQFYNIADSIIAGNFIGKDALAAVGASYPITMIFMAIANGCNVGCCVIISQLFGGKEYSKLKTAVFTSLIGMAGLSALLTTIGALYCRPMLEMLNTPGNILPDSELYLSIYVYGLFFLFLYNICTGIFTALGDSRTPLFFLIASSVANVLMDILFVAVFQMGVGGVAWATFICQGVCSMLALLVLIRRVRKIKADNYQRFSWRMLAKIGTIAIPSVLQQSFVSVGNLFIQGLINGFGSDIVAGYAAAIKLNTFALASFCALSNSVSGFTAQNLGAGKPERIFKGYRSGLIMMLCLVAPVVLVYLLFAPFMINLFVESGADSAVTIATGCEFLYIVVPFYFAVAIKLVSDGALKGVASMGFFMVATFTDLILRVALAFILSPMFGARGIWLSWPLGWVMGGVLSTIFFAIERRRLKRKYALDTK